MLQPSAKMNSVSSSSSDKNKIAYNYDFACTYQMIDDDVDMSNFLYQIQLTNAFCMQKTPGTNTDPSSMFDSSRIQNVFDYLVNVMHLYKNKNFVISTSGKKSYSECPKTGRPVWLSGRKYVRFSDVRLAI